MLYGPTPLQRMAWERMPRMTAERECIVPGLKLWVIRRPIYCDRGEWQVHAETLDQSVEGAHVDGADFFPRLYFSLDAMLAETEAFLRKRGLWKEDMAPVWSDVPAEG